MLDYAREKYADRETSVEVVDINGHMLRRDSGVQKTCTTTVSSGIQIILAINKYPAHQISFHEATPKLYRSTVQR